MASSCRIDFTGQVGGPCSSGEAVRVSRSQPAAMAVHMTPSAWLGFCDRVDAELKPLDSVRNMLLIGMCLTFGVFVVFMIIPVATFATGDPFGSSAPSPFLFVIGPLCAMIGMMVVSCVAQAKARGAIAGVEKVCSETSNQYRSLSFHVRYQYHVYGRYDDRRMRTTNYIEVSVADAAPAPAAVATPVYGGAGGLSLDPPYVPPTVAATAPTASVLGEKSPAARLAELEEMRPMLGADEYDKKRQEIIDGV